MYQNYMEDLAQFCLVLGRFVTILFCDIDGCSMSNGQNQKRNNGRVFLAFPPFRFPPLGRPFGGSSSVNHG